MKNKNYYEILGELNAKLDDEEALLAKMKSTIAEKSQARILGMPNKLAQIALTLSDEDIEQAAKDAVSFMHSEARKALIPIGEKGKSFTHDGKKSGAQSPKTKYIHKLAVENQCTKALALFLAADKKIIGNMSEGRFCNVVSEARKSKP